MQNRSCQVFIADYQNPSHAEAIIFLLDHYARDPMGGDQPLSEYTCSHLVKALAKIQHAFTVLCYVDNQPAGLINCLQGFSTFKCQPLINIHDVGVHKDFRGLGINHRMMELVEQVARERNCCKLTLEVLDKNRPAQRAYEKFGFSPYELNPEMGQAQFWEKAL